LILYLVWVCIFLRRIESYEACIFFQIDMALGMHLIRVYWLWKNKVMQIIFHVCTQQLYPSILYSCTTLVLSSFTSIISSYKFFLVRTLNTIIVWISLRWLQAPMKLQNNLLIKNCWYFKSIKSMSKISNALWIGGRNMNPYFQLLTF
jgi:hypothetical protein